MTFRILKLKTLHIDYYCKTMTLENIKSINNLQALKVIKHLQIFEIEKNREASFDKQD